MESLLLLNFVSCCVAVLRFLPHCHLADYMAVVIADTFVLIVNTLVYIVIIRGIKCIYICLIAVDWLTVGPTGQTADQ